MTAKPSTVRMLRAAAVASVSLLAFVTLAPGCGLENALVGGACKAGFSACGSDCVDLARSPDHCGACAAPCRAGDVCVDGVCGAPSDGSADGRADALADGSPIDGSPIDGASGDGAPGDGAPGDGSPGDACPPPPYNTAARCGSCFVQCTAPNSECLLEGGNFVCKPPCTPPLEPCSGVCVDKQTDPFNCGVCSKVCATLICATGVCQGTNPGHEVVLGHDYAGAVGASAQVKLLTNAVLLSAANPLRILSFEKWAEATTVARIKAFVAAAAFGRTIAYTVSNDEADLRDPLKLSRAEVVLLYDQRTMTAAEATTAGASWAPPLLTFAREGGTVVALDGADGQGQMPQLVRSAGILDLTAHTTLAATSRVAVVAPFDQVGLGVLSPYAVASRSVTLQTNETNGGNVTFVVRSGIAGNGDPTVVHKLVPP